MIALDGSQNGQCGQVVKCIAVQWDGTGAQIT